LQSIYDYINSSTVLSIADVNAFLLFFMKNGSAARCDGNLVLIIFETSAPKNPCPSATAKKYALLFSPIPGVIINAS